jgi:hypothetical protein
MEHLTKCKEGFLASDTSTHGIEHLSGDECECEMKSVRHAQDDTQLHSLIVTTIAIDEKINLFITSGRQ